MGRHSSSLEGRAVTRWPFSLYLPLLAPVTRLRGIRVTQAFPFAYPGSQSLQTKAGLALKATEAREDLGMPNHREMRESGPQPLPAWDRILQNPRAKQSGKEGAWSEENALEMGPVQGARSGGRGCGNIWVGQVPSGEMGPDLSPALGRARGPSAGWRGLTLFLTAMEHCQEEIG